MRRLLFGYFLSQWVVATLVWAIGIWISARDPDWPTGPFTAMIVGVFFIIAYIKQRDVFRGWVHRLPPQELPDRQSLKNLALVGLGTVLGSICLRLALRMALHGTALETVLQDGLCGFLIAFLAASTVTAPVAFCAAMLLASYAEDLRVKLKR